MEWLARDNRARSTPGIGIKNKLVKRKKKWLKLSERKEGRKEGRNKNERSKERKKKQRNKMKTLYQLDPRWKGQDYYLTSFLWLQQSRCVPQCRPNSLGPIQHRHWECRKAHSEENKTFLVFFYFSNAHNTSF